MTQDTMVEVPEDAIDVTPAAPDEPPRRSRRRLRRALLGGVAVLIVVVVSAALWFVFGREQARQVSAEAALAAFRNNGGASAGSAGRPAGGVYTATASGTESIGLPGFDESFGPNAPVMVTHGDEGCFTYRADFNSHHWRSWTFCPTPTATFALTEQHSWTARKAPALNIETLATYTCERPLDFLWIGAAEGETRQGTCTGTNDMDEGVTADAASIEVLDVGSLSIGGTTVDVVHARTTDTFSDAQTGTEVDEWWLDASTGLPVKVVIDASVTGGASDYSETASLTLSTLRAVS